MVFAGRLGGSLRRYEKGVFSEQSDAEEEATNIWLSKTNKLEKPYIDIEDPRYENPMTQKNNEGDPELTPSVSQWLQNQLKTTMPVSGLGTPPEILSNVVDELKKRAYSFGANQTKHEGVHS